MVSWATSAGRRRAGQESVQVRPFDYQVKNLINMKGQPGQWPRSELALDLGAEWGRGLPPARRVRVRNPFSGKVPLIP